MDRLCYLFIRGGLHFGPPLLIQAYIRHFLPPRDFADIWRSLEPNNGFHELKRSRHIEVRLHYPFVRFKYHEGKVGESTYIALIYGALSLSLIYGSLSHGPIN